MVHFEQENSFPAKNHHLFSCIEQNRWFRLQKRVFRTRKKTTSFLSGEKKVVIETESLKKPKKRTTCFAEIKRKGGFSAIVARERLPFTACIAENRKTGGNRKGKTKAFS